MIKKRSKTTEDFKKKILEIDSKFFDDYELLSDYIGSKIDIELLHKKCGHTIKMKPYILYRGGRCSYCMGNHKRTAADVKDLIEDGGDYSFIKLNEKLGVNNKITVKHKKCGNEFSTTPNIFIHGHGCPYCKSGTLEAGRASLYKFAEDNGYSILSEYTGNKNPIKLRHNICGNEFTKTPTHFKGGCGCPYCFTGRKSKGEAAIKKVLKEHNINFITEKTFPDLVDDATLKFDFYIEDMNLLIEYDGIQHYEDTWHDPEKFRLTQKHDNMKNEYCKLHNIELIRIPYWDYSNISEILYEKFKITQKN